MKIKIRQDNASVRHKDGSSQMGDWLAALRDDHHIKPPGDGREQPLSTDDPWSEALAQADALAEARARAQARARSHASALAQADALAEARARAQAQARAGATERPVIGDQLRMPIMWCEIGSCISWYSDRAALGEADTRARAVDAGWRIDALGRLACPECQQTDSGFWAPRSVVPWDRYMAIARAARVAGVPLDDTAEGAAWGGGRDPGRPADAAIEPTPGWQRSQPHLAW